MKAYLVFVVSLTSVYEDAIIADMVKKGYAVSTSYPGTEVSLKSQGNLSAIISLKIEATSKIVNDIHTDVADVLNTHKMMVHSIIVTEYCNAIWSASNIVFEKPALESPSPSSSDKKNVN